MEELPESLAKNHDSEGLYDEQADPDKEGTTDNAGQGSSHEASHDRQRHNERESVHNLLDI
jgi:hypothetical protein